MVAMSGAKSTNKYIQSVLQVNWSVQM